MFRGLKPWTGLCADSSEPGAWFRFWASLFLSNPSPPSFSKINTNFFLIFLNVYFWERERQRDRETECERGRGRERGRHRIWIRLQALSCQHRAWCGARTHELWDHDLRWNWHLTDWATQVPLIFLDRDEKEYICHSMATYQVPDAISLYLREKIPYDFTYIWNMKNKTNEQTKQTLFWLNMF